MFLDLRRFSSALRGPQGARKAHSVERRPNNANEKVRIPVAPQIFSALPPPPQSTQQQMGNWIFWDLAEVPWDRLASFQGVTSYCYCPIKAIETGINSDPMSLKAGKGLHTVPRDGNVQSQIL